MPNSHLLCNNLIYHDPKYFLVNRSMYNSGKYKGPSFWYTTKLFISKNNAPRRDAPVPMSISTAGPSRVQQQRQPSLNYPNFFQPTGPRNFTSQELSNVEINPHHDPYMPNQSSEPSQDFDTYYSYPEEQPSPQDTPDQNLDFENFENNEENFENFPKLASNPELT